MDFGKGVKRISASKTPSLFDSSFHESRICDRSLVGRWWFLYTLQSPSKPLSCISACVCRSRNMDPTAGKKRKREEERSGDKEPLAVSASSSHGGPIGAGIKKKRMETGEAVPSRPPRDAKEDGPKKHKEVEGEKERSADEKKTAKAASDAPAEDEGAKKKKNKDKDASGGKAKEGEGKKKEGGASSKVGAAAAAPKPVAAKGANAMDADIDALFSGMKTAKAAAIEDAAKDAAKKEKKAKKAAEAEARAQAAIEELEKKGRSSNRIKGDDSPVPVR